MKTICWLVYWFLVYLTMIYSLIVWSNRNENIQNFIPEDLEKSTIFIDDNDNIEIKDLTEEELNALKYSYFGLSKLIETATYRNFELYIKTFYDSKYTKEYLEELIEIFQKHTSKHIRIMLVGTGNRELVYWIYENNQLEKVK